ncbi:MAG: ATP-binding protein [Bacteroidia bacterium]|nr:ATP-binding protein [Bacteroidia bacterium]MBP9688147.1 ATP-binding protein [Bacteroidia bacterium]
MATIIGRTKELDAFITLENSSKSEFVAVYGRRRVGKTYLIRNALKNNFTFQLTGLANTSMKQQLANFNVAITKFSKAKKAPDLPTTWFEAFRQLIELLEKSKTSKKVIFIDELPWLDTPKSGFISALEHFWNDWASARKDILLIVCGSAASWMISKLINNKGGLHNRVTHKMKIEPFTLSECESFLQSNNVNWNRHQIIEAYMTMGGIPFYLEAIKPTLSAAQNINNLCFTENGLLNDEFNNLYASLFKYSNNHIAVVEALSKKTMGLTREEIIKLAKLPGGGGTSKVLDELEVSGFIRKYIPLGRRIKDSLYQLTDFYTMFYFKFIKNNKYNNKNYWLNIIDTPKHRAWSGYAFELICLTHIDQLKNALGISGIQTTVASWRSKNAAEGAQVDLLIERKDQVINLIEAKFSINKFTIDKKYAANLRNKIGTFKAETKTNNAVHLSMVTIYGITPNEYATGLVQQSITADSLF